MSPLPVTRVCREQVPTAALHAWRAVESLGGEGGWPAAWMLPLLDGRLRWPRRRPARLAPGEPLDGWTIGAVADGVSLSLRTGRTGLGIEVDPTGPARSDVVLSLTTVGGVRDAIGRRWLPRLAAGITDRARKLEHVGIRTGASTVPMRPGGTGSRTPAPPRRTGA